MPLLLLLALLALPNLAAAQGNTAFPIFLGRSVTLLPPTVDAAGRTVVFGSGLTPNGATVPVVDLYAAAVDGSGLRQLTHLTSGSQAPPQGANAVSLSSSGGTAAFTALMPLTTLPPGILPPIPVGSGNVEQVHVVDVASGADRTVAVDTQGCIQPLAALCVNCFFYCVNTPHLTPDAGKVLYAVRRQQPFYIVNSDGTGLTNLPVFSGALAPAPQRAIGRSGLVVFTSSSPFGPTFVAAATDVYAMNLDGSNIRAVTKFGSDTSLFTNNATISADGSTIAFESNRDPDTGKAGNITHVWVVRSDGSGLRPLTFAVTCLSLDCPQPGGNSPSISGDGSLVAFVNGGRIFVARSDGSGSKLVTNFKTSATQDPVISEDGLRVVFTIGPLDSGGRGAIYSVKTDGGALQAVYAPHALNPNGVASAIAGAQPSPGSLISVYGVNLAPDGLVVAGSFPLPISMAGVSLLVNGIPAPLLAVTPWQVNAQLPPETQEGAAAFQLRFVDGSFAAAVAANVAALAPAIFTVPSGAISQAAVFHGNTGVLVDPAHPASAGEAVAIYGMGLGMANPFVAAGLPAPSSPPARTLVTPDVLVGSATAQVTFSGLTPGLAGVYQVNAVIPSGLKPGQYVVRWRVGTITSSSFGTITLQ